MKSAVLRNAFAARGRAPRRSLCSAIRPNSQRFWRARKSLAVILSSSSRTIIRWSRQRSRWKGGWSPMSPATSRTSTSTKAIPPCSTARCRRRNLDIRLNRPVKRIEWEPASVRVFARNLVLQARAVIVTLPLGVLQADDVEFDGPLPRPFGNDRIHELFVRAEWRAWHLDRFSRSGYSGFPDDADWDAREALGQPVADTLFFAGEAVGVKDKPGHVASVHGAIASGIQVAREVVASLRN